MPSTYSVNKSIQLPANGSFVGNWDIPTNFSLASVIDIALGGHQSLNATGASGNVALTSSTDGNGDVTAQWQAPNIIITGTLTANVTYQFPSGVGGIWTIFNNTTGAFSITIVSLGAGRSVVIPQGSRLQVVSDGTNVDSVLSYLPLLSTQEIALLGATSGYAGFQAPATPANIIWTLPAADGSAGQALVTNGSGVLGWTTVSGGISPSGNNTWTGTQTFNGTSSTLAAIFKNVAEVATVSATAATGTVTYYVNSQSVLYYTSNASGNWTLNIAFSAGTSLNTAMSVGQSITIAFLVTQGSTAFYNSQVQIDGTNVTPKWQGGSAPTAGNPSGIDVYVLTIIKTGSATYTVLASLTQF